MPGGRRKKPTALHILQGTDRKDRINENEPKPDYGIPEPAPGRLNAQERAIYDRLATILNGMAVLTMVDGIALELFAQALYTYYEARKKMKRQPLVITLVDNMGRTTMKKNPWLVVMENARTAVNQYLSRFGLDPSSRAHLKANIGEVPSSPRNDKWSDL
jgi:P27 family predicted phage terminase small subunit